ncbi:LapA family protein [Pseudanabaena biceps]|nr:LapA family protein [Pseudanabaena biceps]
MTKSRFSQVNKSPNSSSKGAIAIFQLLFLGLAITALAAIFVQNLQPTVQVVFFGQKTVAIPLSVAMASAAAIGGVLAFTINAIAAWRHNQLIRRAVIAAGFDSPESNPDIAAAKKPREYEDEQEYEELDEEEEFEEDYEIDDPDTLPYGDRFKDKSKPKSNSSAKPSDRPPLDAKFIK